MENLSVISYTVLIIWICSTYALKSILLSAHINKENGQKYSIKLMNDSKST